MCNETPIFRLHQASLEGGQLGQFAPGPNLKRSPRSLSARGVPGTSSKEAPFGSLSVLINFFPLCFKWKSNNWIRFPTFIESTLFIYSLNTEPGQDMHVFTRIVIFRLSGKEPDESTIVKRNVDQNNFCTGVPQISILPRAPPRLWAGLRCTVIPRSSIRYAIHRNLCEDAL